MVQESTKEDNPGPKIEENESTQNPGPRDETNTQARKDGVLADKQGLQSDMVNMCVILFRRPKTCLKQEMKTKARREEDEVRKCYRKGDERTAEAKRLRAKGTAYRCM